MPTPYQLRNTATGRLFPDSGWDLSDPQSPQPALLRTYYAHRQLQVGPGEDGLYKFACWLPIRRKLVGSQAPVTYKSEGLAQYLGLPHLYITFSGYWPQRNAFMETCSFKETEAYAVCGRLPEEEKRTLVVASAGNTARAFARVCSQNRIPLLLCVPPGNLDALWFDHPLDPCVELVCPPEGSDYFDAIQLADSICQDPAYLAEGGAKNVARRDGMGTTVLSAATFIGRLPHYYFQAIGSGTGTIAAWEANLRLLADGRFGTHTMTLLPSQNAPFLPMYNAWKDGARKLPALRPRDARSLARQIDAKVLSNRQPPYGIAGGLFDCLTSSGGHIDCATNEELRAAGKLFEQLEGIDIHPAAAVAVATLCQRAQQGRLDPSKIVMLNITGGGEALYKATHTLHYLKPTRVVE